MKRQAKSYSIVDHELLHGGYLGRLSHKAIALYLFLAVVGDSEGKSFYSTPSMGKILRMDPADISLALRELIKERLIDHKPPFWIVLSLTYSLGSRGPDRMICLKPLISQVLKKNEVMKMLDPSTQAEVLRLYFAEHLSKRAISARLGIHRQSVAALVSRKQVLLDRKDTNRRSSIIAPYHAGIEELLRIDPGRSAVNILQKIRDKGYTGGLTILKDHLRICRPISEPKAYLSLEFVPGQAAQVDWGDFGDYFGIGRKLWCFVMVLCWSRLLYLEFTHSAAFESFLRCHENAFEFFGGIPRELWYDNLATAVAERKQKIIRFNPKFMAYSGHCCFKPVACNPCAGNEKGRVEDGVRYIRGNFWPGRVLADLSDANGQARTWMDRFANKRTHSATRKIPELHFAGEKPYLLPLAHPYDTDEICTVNVSHQFRVRFDANEYSVPWRLSGRTLTLRADIQTVSLYINRKRVCTHGRCWDKGKSVINKKHEDGLTQTKPGAQTSSDIAALKTLGPNACRYVELMGAQNNSIRTELGHLMVLITVYGPENVEKSIKTVLENGIIGAHHLERLLERSQNPEDIKPRPLALSDARLNIPPYIPNLKSYDTLLFDPEQTENKEDTDGESETPFAGS